MVTFFLSILKLCLFGLEIKVQQHFVRFRTDCIIQEAYQQNFFFQKHQVLRQESNLCYRWNRFTLVRVGSYVATIKAPAVVETSSVNVKKSKRFQKLKQLKVREEQIYCPIKSKS